MSFTGPVANIEMIGYLHGFVIAKNEWGDLFVSERPKEFYFPGELIERESLTPLSDLPRMTQAIILRHIHAEGGEQ